MNQRTNLTESNQGLAALSDALRRSFIVLRWVMLLLLFGYLLSGIFVVKQHEKAVVLRFGRLVGIGDNRVLPPGFHWTWPKPFSEIIRLPAGRVWSISSKVFWHGQPEDQRDQFPPTLQPLIDGYTLSGDANLLHSQWAVRFTIDDPEAHLFGVAEPTALLERELNRAVVMVSARMPVDALLRADIEGFRQQVEQELRIRVAAWPLGIRVQGVDLLQLSPPLQVAEAFDQVVRAEQEQAQAVTDARAYAARIINEAVGQADQVVAEGETAKVRLINRIKADADYFTQVQPAVARQPQLMRRIIWQDAIREALGTVGQLYLVPSDADGRREIRLQLSPRRANPFTEGTP